MKSTVYKFKTTPITIHVQQISGENGWSGSAIYLAEAYIMWGFFKPDCGLALLKKSREKLFHIACQLKKTHFVKVN